MEIERQKKQQEEEKTRREQEEQSILEAENQLFKSEHASLFDGTEGIDGIAWEVRDLLKAEGFTII